MLFSPSSEIRQELKNYYNRLKAEHPGEFENIPLSKIWDIFDERAAISSTDEWEKTAYSYFQQYVKEYPQVDEDRVSVDTAMDQRGFFLGGSPIASKIALTQCNIFGYNGGVSNGSIQEEIINKCGFYRMGSGRFSHPWYLSGGYSPGSITHGVVFTNNIVIGGQGWGIHGWHKIHEAIITGNFVSGMKWGIVMGQYGDEGRSTPPTSHTVVSNNFVWRTTGAGNFGSEGPIGMWIDGEHMIVSGNMFGPDAPVISLGNCENSNRTAPRQNILIGQDPNQPICPGDIQIDLAQMESEIGFSAELIDFMIAELEEIYSDPARIIERIEEKQRYESLLRFSSWPEGSTLNTGSFDWQHAVCPGWDKDSYWWTKQQNTLPYGPPGLTYRDLSDPWTMYEKNMEGFQRLGLKRFDNNGQIVPDQKDPDCFQVRLPITKKE